jgi:HAD superfamily hydrolase (TIGR01490 family)
MLATAAYKIAIYDMDKTITRRATYNGFLAHMALNRAPWRLLFLPLLPLGLLLYLCKIWERRRLKEFSQSLLIGRRVHRSEFEKYLESHADLVLGKNVYHQLIQRVADEKIAGYIHVVATASYALYVDTIAQKLGFEHVIATDLATDDSGHILARIDGHNCYDLAKLGKVKSWMNAKGFARQDYFIRAYSDHISDMPLLEYADEAFATNPHPPLAKAAKAKGWEILDWRDQPI